MLTKATRELNDKTVKYVANSIKKFGFLVPIVIDKDNVIICGHTRYLESQELDLKLVPCIRAENLTDKQIKAFRVADNKVILSRLVDTISSKILCSMQFLSANHSIAVV